MYVFSVHVCGDAGRGQPGCLLGTLALLQQGSFSLSFSKRSPETSSSHITRELTRNTTDHEKQAEGYHWLREEGKNSCPMDVLQG